jgi:hypothetical protein
MGSASVIVREQDVSTRVPSFPGVYAGIVIPALKGEVDVPYLVTSEKQLLDVFTPDKTIKVGYDNSHFSALAYLQSADKLWVVRAANTPLFGGCKIHNIEVPNDPGEDEKDLFATPWSVGSGAPDVDLDAESGHALAFIETDVLALYGANPGEWNDNISVEIYTYEDSPTVVKEDGAFLVIVRYNNVEVERHICSLDSNHLDGFGRNIYVDNILSGSSYIRGFKNIENTDEYPPECITMFTSFSGGSDGNAVTDADMIRSLDKLENPEDKPCTLILDGGRATAAYHTEILRICEARMDCFGILTVPYANESHSDYVNQILEYRRETLNANTSFGCLISPAVKIYDKYNDRSIYIAPDGYFGGVISQTAAKYEIWYPPAGPKRGMIKVLDLRRRFTKGEMDLLYDAGINPIRFQPGKGIMINGQKTLLARPSALDRINVRLLLMVIEPAIKEALEDFLFDLNTVGTRSQVTSIIKSYMTGIMARNGVYFFEVICDDTNNTPEDIDNYLMNVDLYVQPTKAIETIPFTVIIMKTGMSVTLAQAAT